MANRARTQGGDRDEFTIHLSHLEMLKLERLMKSLSNWGTDDLTGEELSWASNAQQLFAPELPSGTYEI